MAQAFVQKVFQEKRTDSIIQVPVEKSSIDENQVKEVLQAKAKEFISEESKTSTSSEKCFTLASILNQALVAQVPSIKDHKVVVNVTISEQWGQGCKALGRCLWNTNCDRVVRVDVTTEKEICIISAFFSKIPEESSDEDEAGDGID